MKYVFISIIALGLMACDKPSSTDTTKERAAAEQEGANKVENDNLAKKAEIMESDLASRHLFYNSIEGEYAGSLAVDDEAYNISFTFTRSLPPYQGNRVRQLSEIENDLNNLFFNVQISQWHPSDETAAFICSVSGIRPNMTDGTLVVISTECRNLYNLFLSEGNKAPNKGLLAKSIASQVKSGNLANVEFLTGTAQLSSSAKTYSFKVKRMQ